MTQNAVTLAFAVAILCCTTAAETITVCPDGCDFVNINPAIAAANDGDVIQLSATTYVLFNNIDTLGKAVVIRGTTLANGHPATTIDGWIECRTSESASTVFENLIILGKALFFGSSPSVINCSFDGSKFRTTSHRGGAVYTTGGSPSFELCSFSRHSAENGGAVFINSGSAHFLRCTFSSNEAGFKGGAVAHGSVARSSFEYCSFLQNSAGNMGGAVFQSGNDISYIGCEFSNNEAGVSGGGIHSTVNTEGTITGCVFDSNTAGTQGDALANLLHSNLHIVNCSFLGCCSTQDGIWNDQYTIPTIEGSMFADCCQVIPLGSFADGGDNKNGSRCDECRANLDCRGNRVDSGDLGLLLAVWNTSDPTCDIDNNGIVDAADLGLLVASWGPCP